MSRYNGLISRVAPIILGISPLLYGSQAGAVTVTTDAVVDVVVALTVDEDLDMQFGKVSRPTVGDNAVTLSTASTRSISGGGDGILVGGGTVRAAQYTITTDSGNILDISATQNTAQTGLSLSDFTGNYDSNGESGINPVDSFSISAVSNATLLVGATLNIDSTASAGINTLTYDLLVDIQ